VGLGLVGLPTSCGSVVLQSEPETVSKSESESVLKSECDFTEMLAVA